ncbi:MAG: hypothetical protein VKO26_01915 [Cyanobacteriota bacterium]|nr:hypothetical protein [Cyanobacteriota bacterium]
MPSWTSPWPVAAALDAHLRAAGVKRCEERLDALPGDVLILYSPPDALLASGLASAQDPPTPPRLATSYKQLQAFHGRHHLIATWRLQALTPEAIRGWLEQASPPRASQLFPDPEPLSALLAKTLMDSQPDLLDAYLDLELIAELAGGAPDTAYPRRLANAIADSQTLLEHCWLPHQHNQALRQDIAAQLVREDALAIESQRAREAEALLRVQVDQAREERERLAQATRVRDDRLAQLEETLVSQVSRLLRLEAEVDRSRAEREEALATAADLQPQLAARDEELRSAREAEVGLRTRMEALRGENRRAHEEAEERLLRQLHALEEHERLVLDVQGHKSHITELKAQLATQAEAVRLSRQDRDRDRARVVALETEREALLQARADLEGRTEALEVRREALERENAAALAREADLQFQLASYEREARQARDAEVRLLDRVGLLERENQRMREDSEAMGLQLDHLRGERDRREQVERDHGILLRQLEDTMAGQARCIAALETDKESLRGERDRARQQREETLRQARVTEADLQARVQALQDKNGQASEETRRLTDQLHHLHEELEQIFLQGQAGDALIAAQHQQLQRAQSLMSRLLVQTTQPMIPTQAVSVEVLPSPPATALAGTSQTSDSRGRQRRSARLLRRFWTP